MGAHHRPGESPTQRRAAFRIALLLLPLIVLIARTTFGGLSLGPLHIAIAFVAVAFVAWLTFVLWRRTRLDDHGEDRRS